MASLTAYRDWIDAHYTALYRYAYRLSGSEADACDLVQETYLQAYRAIDQLREPQAVRSWLFRILLNLYLHRRRRSGTVSYVPPESLIEQEDHRPNEPPYDDWDVDPQQLQKVLDELDDAYRLPLILFYFEEMSYKDIAEILQVPMGTVMSRLSRAKAYLRDKLMRVRTPARKVPERNVRNAV